MALVPVALDKAASLFFVHFLPHPSLLCPTTMATKHTSIRRFSRREPLRAPLSENQGNLAEIWSENHAGPRDFISSICLLFVPFFLFSSSSSGTRKPTEEHLEGDLSSSSSLSL